MKAIVQIQQDLKELKGQRALEAGGAAPLLQMIADDEMFLNTEDSLGTESRQTFVSHSNFLTRNKI